MTEKGIRVTIHEGRVWIAAEGRHNNGYAFTDQQLAERDQRIWAAAREKNEREVLGFKYYSFADYESKKGGQDD
jgi:hypothetical protein